MNGIESTLAFKYVALALMLAEVNFFGTKVGLQLDHPVTAADVRSGSHVGPPKTNDFSGSVVTDKYFFGFGWGHLANFHRNDFKSDSDAAVRERNLKLSKQLSLIDTNGAYEVATNWLTAAGVNLVALQKGYKLNIMQWRYRPEGLSQGPTLLPVYQVVWHGSLFRSQRRRSDTAVVSLTILGPTKELIEYHVLDDSLFLRSRLQITEPQKLLAIPDAEFETFDTLQRSNLLAQFTLEAQQEMLPAVPNPK
jgi:hypothetical protein